MSWRRPALFLCLLLLAIPVAAAAQIRGLEDLEADRRRVGHHTDSLMSVRVRLVFVRDSLSMRSDSLWSQDPESAQLVQARLASRALVERLGETDQGLDSLAARRDSLDESLRESYDWEISRLLRLLTDEGWDAGLFRQLLVYQEEREALGTAPVSPQRIGDELSVSEQDGPEEIRQKISVAQDKVAECQHEERDIERRLGHLEREVLVMRKYWHLSREVLRLRAPSETDRLQVREGTDGASGELALRPERGSRGARVVPVSDEAASPEVPADAGILLEMRKLKARQQELRELEVAWQERVAAFHARLALILDGD